MDLNVEQATADFGAFGAMLWAWGVEFLPRLGVAVLILIVGFMVAGWASRLVRAAIERTRHIDPTLEPIAGTAIRYAVIVVILVAALGQLGVQTTSLLAVLGAAGLAIGLALQGTLANIAAGIMLLYLRPFRMGDSIETATVSGQVREIGLFVTHLQTPDGLFLFVPNSALWNVPLKNHSRNPQRLVTVTLSVSYTADLAEVRQVLLDLAAAEADVLADPPPTVTVESYMDNRIVVALRAWASTSAFGDVQRTLSEAAKGRLQAAGIKVPI